MFRSQECSNPRLFLSAFYRSAVGSRQPARFPKGMTRKIARAAIFVRCFSMRKRVPFQRPRIFWKTRNKRPVGRGGSFSSEKLIVAGNKWLSFSEGVQKLFPKLGAVKIAGACCASVRDGLKQRRELLTVSLVPTFSLWSSVLIYMG